MVNLDSDRVRRVAGLIRTAAMDTVGWVPNDCIVLGSGLGGFGGDQPGMKEVLYPNLELLPCKVKEHAGVCRFVMVEGHRTMVFDGRIHRYEGHDLQDIVLGVRGAALVGVHNFIITCAAGAINAYDPGEIVIIGDHINLMGDSPLEGENDPDLGPRYPDMTRAYDPELRALAEGAFRSLGREPKTGTYVASKGPSYETPAEVRYLRAIGGDLAGMSTVPEVIALAHLRGPLFPHPPRVLGLSCATNPAAGVTPKPLSHAEVTKQAAESAPFFRRLLEKITSQLPT